MLLGHSAPLPAVQRARISQELGTVNRGSALPRHVLTALQHNLPVSQGRWHLRAPACGTFPGHEHSWLLTRLPQGKPAGPQATPRLNFGGAHSQPAPASEPQSALAAARSVAFAHRHCSCPDLNPGCAALTGGKGGCSVHGIKQFADVEIPYHTRSRTHRQPTNTAADQNTHLVNSTKFPINQGQHPVFLEDAAASQPLRHTKSRLSVLSNRKQMAHVSSESAH